MPPGSSSSPEVVKGSGSGLRTDALNVVAETVDPGPTAGSELCQQFMSVRHLEQVVSRPLGRGLFPTRSSER